MRALVLAGSLLVVDTGCNYSRVQPAADADDGPSVDASARDAAAADAPDDAGITEAPTVPVLLTPIRNASLGSIHVPGSLRPTFAWEPSTATTSAPIFYHLERSTDAFATDVTTVATTAMTSFTPTDDLQVSRSPPVGARIYWRVRACLTTGDCSAYSPVRRLDLGRSDRDLNGDGYVDVVVGAPLRDPAAVNPGRAYVYLGGVAATFPATPDGTLTAAAASPWFGTSVAFAGDLDSDGFADLIVGDPNKNASDAGRAHVYFGNAGGDFAAGAHETIIGVVGERFGSAVASAGDVNGDGYADVIIGAIDNDTPQPEAGHAFVYLGNAGRIFAASDGILAGVAGAGFGGAVASAGDVNGDGFADVVVGASRGDSAHLYFGGAGEAFDATEDGLLVGTMAGSSFGRAVAPAGDVDGDGFADVIVGAMSDDTGGADAGLVHVYFGGASGPFASATLTGAAAGDFFGSSVAAAGDVNGDGFADVIVGALGSDAEGTGSGAASVHFGGADRAFSGAADWTLARLSSRTLLGISVASAGDVNRDGFADVIASAAGTAYMYFGGAGDPLDGAHGVTFPWIVPGEYYGWSVATSATPTAP